MDKKEPVYLIIHWLSVQMFYGIENSDESYNQLLQEFDYMDRDIEKMISYEELAEIVDKLIAGKNVKL